MGYNLYFLLGQHRIFAYAEPKLWHLKSCIQRPNSWHLSNNFFSSKTNWLPDCQWSVFNNRVRGTLLALCAVKKQRLKLKADTQIFQGGKCNWQHFFPTLLWPSKMGHKSSKPVWKHSAPVKLSSCKVYKDLSLKQSLRKVNAEGFAVTKQCREKHFRCNIVNVCKRLAKFNLTG